ncbi:MAG: isochorismatase family protein [Deltaproteobacteria bacterium]|nr:isochorismatase family protein [Deltaproteobacteria bacterium]
MRHPFVADRKDSLLLIIDIQQAMLKVIDVWEENVRRAKQLINSANILGVPVLVTEHYKKGLGETIPEVKKELGGVNYFQKEYFSACLETDFIDAVRNFGRRQIVVAGMETHVCVLQTVLDLIAHGYQVHVVKNAVASRYREDWEAAIEIFRDAGAVITTAEIVIFQWICRSNTEDFRKVLPIVK